MKIKSLLVTITTVVLLVGCVGVYVSADSSNTYKSQGNIIFNNGTEDTVDDVVFDASDFATIDAMIEDSKKQISDSLNAYPNAGSTTLDSFANLSDIIDSLTNVPDVYYYDKSTEGENCQRYVLEEGNYYPCDKGGVKTSDTALTGTIVVVDKNDTSTPAAGEVYLVQYVSADEDNISAGYAGYADKNFILGSGADNIIYKELGGGACYYLGTSRSYNISSIVGAANVGNYTSSNFIVVTDSFGHSLSCDADSSHIGHDATASVSVTSASASYEPSTGVVTVTGGAWSMSQYMKYSDNPSESGNLGVKVYFLDNVVRK